MPDTLRDTLSAAYDELAAEPAPGAAPVAETPPEPAAAAPEPSSETPAAPERVRDPETGRFTPKPPEKAAAPQQAPAAAKAPGDGATSPPPPSPAPVTPVEPKWKAPQSWKPAVREKWVSLPPEVQEEIARREGEVPKALEQAAQARRFQEAVNETLRPYEMLARAAGQHPVQYAAGLMQTAAALQTGAPAQRAAVVANIIRQFGVDVEQLAAALDGQPAQAQPQHQPQADPRTLVREELDRLRGEALQQSAQRYAEEFSTKFEFGSDPRVRSLAAAIIESEAQAGVEVSPEEAYNRAAMAVPDIRTVLEQRKAADAAKAQQSSTQRAKAAATGIKSQPTAAPAAQPKGLRAVLEAKYDELAAQ